MKNHKLPSRLLALALCLCMVLSLMPMMPLVAEAATVPNYISSIGISQDGSSGSTGVNDCKRELAGHTIIDVDLNDEAGGDYVYMGYKTTTDPAQAITGIVFRVGKNPPNSISYGGSTFYLVGGSTEANTAQLGGYIDLNAKAGGYYIYTYVTRDPNYGAPLTNLTVNRSNSYSGWYAGTDTNGNVMDLNDDASNYYMYLHYQRFSGKASSTFYYLTSGGSRTSYTTSVSVKNHTQSVSTTPLMPSTVTYDGRTFTFRGWREDNTASSSTVSPSYTYMTSKTYRAVYSATVTLSYNANGGSGAPSSQTATQYINAGSSSVSKTSHSFTISATKPTHDDSKCIYLGWSTGSSATSASHQPSQTITISSNTTLYAVWRGAHTANRTYVNNGANHTYTWPCCGKSVTEAHSYTDGFCVCGAMIPDAVATVSKNGKVVAAYTTLNDAIQAVQDCTAADEAVVTILKDIALGNNYQKITSGVFTIDLNGFEISSTNSDYGALYVYGATVTIQDSGEDGKITGKRAGIEVFEGELTVLDGTVSGGSSRDNYGVYASGSSTVTISGGSFSGYYGVYATGSSTVTISGGTISGESAGVCADRSNVNISSGSISSDSCGVYACNKSTVKISGGSVSSHDYGMYAYYSTVTVSDGIVSGDFRGVDAYSSTVTISGGSVSGDASGVYAYNASTVTISGGTVSGNDFGVDAYVSSTVTISGGTVSGVSCGVYACNRSTVTVSGGSISFGNYGIRNNKSIIALTLGDDGVGATFRGGITVLDTTLNEILGEGAAYWQGNIMALPADDATEITGGDVVIKSTCPHASKSNYTDLKDGASHTYFCSGCNNTFTESHSYDATTLLCVCGAAHSDAVASVSKNGKVVAAYATLDDAIQAVKNCTAADKAVVTILQDIALGNSIQGIYSGVFTIDLNGHEISSTNASWGTLYIHGSAPNVTIQGTGENSKITGNYAGIEISYGVNLTIAGGTISGDWYGVYADGSNVTISGGSISSNTFDIACYSSTVTLTVDEDGVGARFPGGIEVRVTTLNAVLGEGAAYWQGNTMILPADGATKITGGDVVIKAECKHPGDKTYTNNGDDHSYTYSCCNNTVTEGHSYSNGLCVCGAMVSDAVASVSKNGIVTGAYTTLNDAIQAVRNCTAADKAVVTILQDIALGDSYQEISSGVFTIDLNSKTLSGTNSNYGVLYLDALGVNVTVTDSGTGGTISGDCGVVAAYHGEVTISGGTISGDCGVVAQELGKVIIVGGTISGDNHGVAANFSGNVIISGGTISGKNHGVYADNSHVTITDGAISGERYGVYATFSNYVTISGGSISGDTYDIISSLSTTMILTLGENGVGASFPGGIKVYDTTLNEILDEGAAYWQGNTMILPANNATEIPGGDVVIKAVCPHTASKTGYVDLKDGANHTYVCSGCNVTLTEAHSYDATTLLCVCGAAHSDAVASVSKNGVVTGAYTTLNDAIQAVKYCTAADKAIVTILKDIALGDSYQGITSGVFTIDLNGHEISSTRSGYGALYITEGATNVTIQGAGENSKITGNFAGIEIRNNASLTITGGTISSEYYGMYADGSTVTITGGTISGETDGMNANNSTVTINGGTIGGSDYGVYANNSTVTISGGSMSGYMYDIRQYNSTIALTLGENGIGATFPDGIMTDGILLNEILGEGAAYWQGSNMIIPNNRDTLIVGDDVVIKAICDHSGNVSVDDNDCSTKPICSECNVVISESLDHDFDDNGFCVNCSGYQPAQLKNGWYQITNGGNLFWFAQQVNGDTIDVNAVLTNNIDLENRNWTPIGYAIAYEGIIDGAGYTVSGLKVSGYRNFAGFIGKLKNGGVKNLTLFGTVDDHYSASGYVGLLVGEMNDSALYNCKVSGSVKATVSANCNIGGLVGYAHHCVIINCGSEADVTLLYEGTAELDAFVGGLAGSVTIGVETPVCVLNSYAVGNITVGTKENPWSGKVTAGGIVGHLRDDAVNNYFYGNIDVQCNGTSEVGYAFGYVQGYSYLSNASTGDAPIDLIISNNYYPNGKTAVGAGLIYVNGADQNGIDESWTTAVSEANIKAVAGENALVYILNSNVPYVERIIEEHLGFLSESAWATIVENIGGVDFTAQKWVVINGHPVHGEYSGWTEINGDWYYYDPDTNTPVTGITRVPYPAQAINGVTYAPNMEDVKYANDKGTLFKDSISAFFVFDENGVFQSGLNGMTSDNSWAVNGCIVWHVGLVQVGEEYYYFIGDADNGGNKMATGDIYANRNTTDFDMVPGGVYTFGEDGKLCKNEGIVNLRYYENYRLMLGNGLTKVGENYIYVNSKGELIVDAEYYVPGNDLGITSGLYYFDENGYLVEPVSTDKDGVYFENGAWYYYVDGKIGYNQGLISVNTTWHGADGSENVYSGYIYVRSSGKLATGEYYITNVSNDASGLFTMGMKVLFNENGIADAPKNGIYEINGELYYFVKNQIQYNAGLIEYNGGWIYVRSSGKLAVGDYWITNTNGAMDQGMYEFGENGYMVIVDIEDGIVSDNGVLYYYEGGKKQYGLGLRQLSDGSYIYVRTNGELATGSYWITNHNGLLPEGLYTFGDDGILVEN